MFGLTEQEMDLYKDLAQDFAVKDVAPDILGNAKFITPLIENGGGKPKPDTVFVRQLLTDIETIITLTASHMAYDYAHLQCDEEKEEKDIIKHLHKKYDDYLVVQFLKYGIAFTEDVTNEILGQLLLELPYIYMSVIDDESFDEDEFLEERMDAYDEYLSENFPEEEEEEEDDN